MFLAVWEAILCIIWVGPVSLSRRRKSYTILHEPSDLALNKLFVVENEEVQTNMNVAMNSGDVVLFQSSKVMINNSQSSVNILHKENVPLEEVYEHLKCTREGLTSDGVQEWLEVFGYNKLEEKKENKFYKFLGFMWNPLSW